MTAANTSDVSFKEQERTGWETKARAYDTLAGKVTAQAVEPLLEVARVAAGTVVLDVACGPGYVAGGAAARGATAVGIDFAPSMVTEAARHFPSAEFRQGDAEALDFASGSFDAVVCAFGLLHLAAPEKAIAEAYRVLRPGGRYAFTVWSVPERHEFFAVVLGAIQAHGTLDVPLPPAPPFFRFSEPGECRKVLSAAGFCDIAVAEIPLVWELTSPQQLLDMIQKSTVRMAMLLELQTAEAREKIYQAIVENAEQFRKGGAFAMAWPAVMASASKPI
jgi:ubiquinone/menaquinone biosynthesis C-methylase UbiE